MQAHADLRGCEATNDKFSESIFGVFDRMLKRNENISREGASALAQAMRNKSLARSDAIERRKPRDPPPPTAAGYMFTLPWQEQEALVIYSHRMVRESRKMDSADNAEVAAYVKAKVKTASDEELAALITEYGYGLSFFARWQSRGVRTEAEMDAKVSELSNPQERLDWMREQIEMRTRGLQWTEFATKWSSGKDETVGSFHELRRHLLDILQVEHGRRAANELPSYAPAPQMKRKTLKQLGTLSAQGKAFLEQHEEPPPEELRRLAERELERLEEAGEISTVSDAQPSDAPAFNSLLGKEIEIRWRYWESCDPATDPRGRKKRQVYIWCAGVVTEIADGRKTTGRAVGMNKQDILPYGALRVKWEADADHEEAESYTWSILKPVDWAQEVAGGWRYAPAELARMAVERKRARKK